MSTPDPEEESLEELERLSPAEREKAAKLVRELVSPLADGASVEELLAAAAAPDDESGEHLLEALERGGGDR